jgi:hypothetical protein
MTRRKFDMNSCTGKLIKSWFYYFINNLIKISKMKKVDREDWFPTIGLLPTSLKPIRRQAM